MFGEYLDPLQHFKGRYWSPVSLVSTLPQGGKRLETSLAVSAIELSKFLGTIMISSQILHRYTYTYNTVHNDDNNQLVVMFRYGDVNGDGDGDDYDDDDECHNAEYDKVNMSVWSQQCICTDASLFISKLHLRDGNAKHVAVHGHWPIWHQYSKSHKHIFNPSQLQNNPQNRNHDPPVRCDGWFFLGHCGSASQVDGMIAVLLQIGSWNPKDRGENKEYLKP